MNLPKIYVNGLKYDVRFKKFPANASPLAKRSLALQVFASRRRLKMFLAFTIILPYSASAVSAQNIANAILFSWVQENYGGNNSRIYQTPQTAFQLGGSHRRCRRVQATSCPRAVNNDDHFIDSGLTYLNKLTSILPGSSHGIMCAEFSNQTSCL